MLYPLNSKISLDDYVPAEKSHSRLQNMILSSYPVLCDVVRISEKKKTRVEDVLESITLHLTRNGK